MSLRSPLGLGTARDGTSHFWAQRVSAIALAIFGIWFAWILATTTDFSHAAVVAEIRRPVNAILMLLLSVTMAYHSYLGIQVVIEDYVHAPAINRLSLLLSRFTHIAFTVAAIYAIATIGLGA